MNVSSAQRLKLWHVLFFGLFARLAGLAAFHDLDFRDARAYREMGQNLITKGTADDSRYMPLYPLWTQLTGDGIATLLADIALSTLTIWVIYRLAQEIVGDRRAAMLAAIGAAAYPHFIFYSVAGLTETGFTLLLLLGFYALYRERYAWGAVAMVSAILVRPLIDPLAPVLILVFALIVHRRPWRFAIGRLAIYAAIYVALMSPWWVHNYAAYGSFVRLSLGDGIVFYAGNNPRNQSGGGLYGVDVNYDDLDLTGLDRVERNRRMNAAAWTYIAENPGRFVEMAAIKFVRLWRLWPHTDQFQSPMIIVASLASYGVVLFLALTHLVAEGRKRWRVLIPPVLFAVFVTAVHMVTIGSIRYRFPIEPFLIVFAAALLARWSRRLAWLDTWLGGDGPGDYPPDRPAAGAS